MQFTKDNQMLLTDDQGVEHMVEILFTYENEERHANYVLYFLPENPEEVFAARIEGEQTATAQMLKANAPPPLSHNEPDPEQPGTKSEQWMKLYNAGKFDEAAEFRRANLNAIQRGE